MTNRPKSAPADVRFPPLQGWCGVPAPWWGARVVEWTGFENRRGFRVTVGSNPTPTAYRGLLAPAHESRIKMLPAFAREVGVGFEPTGFAKQSAPWVRRPKGAAEAQPKRIPQLEAPGCEAGSCSAPSHITP